MRPRVVAVRLCTPCLRSSRASLRYALFRRKRKQATILPPLPPKHAPTLRSASTGPDIPPKPIDPAAAPARWCCPAWLRSCSTHACSNRMRQGPNREAALGATFVSPPSSGFSPANPPSHPGAELDSIYRGRQSPSPALAPHMPAKPLTASPSQPQVSAPISKHPAPRVGEASATAYLAGRSKPLHPFSVPHVPLAEAYHLHQSLLSAL